MITLGGKIDLREWNLSDAGSLVLNANNINISQWLTDRFPYPYKKSDALEWIGLCLDQVCKTNLAIAVNGKAVGNIGIMPGKDIYCKTAELGYWLGQDYWNMGIMSQVIRDFTNYCFNTLKINRIFARVFEDNLPSSRVLQNAGYTFQCILKNEILKKGKVKNALLYDQINPIIYRSLF